MDESPEHACAPDFDIADPKPAALIESLRAFGYTIPAAVADLVDNSISAEARQIQITFHWAGPASWFRILDDGRGMSEAELVDAMRAGSTSPRETRSPGDLGRFGLGLKTASFSQCRRLTVASRQDDRAAVRQWDLDEVQRSGQWRLLKSTDQETAALTSLSGESGTAVLWQAMDRIAGSAAVDDRRAHERFLKTIEDVEHHLGATFHRFLSGPGSVSISINGNPVQPWDPFLTAHPATQPLPEETIWYQKEQMAVKAFVLPHHGKMSRIEHEAAAGTNGWNAQQGFYVYRNRRLIVAGSWLGLGFTKDEHTKLARIRVDLPNSLDEAWQLDVRKASARPPGPTREDFKRIARTVRERADEVYRFRGKPLGRTSVAGPAFVWFSRDVRGKIHYRLNREHPAVAGLLSTASGGDDRERFLRLIEETVPVPLIARDHAVNGLKVAAPLEDYSQEEIDSMIDAVLQLLAGQEMPLARIESMILAIEPFDQHPGRVAAAIARHAGVGSRHYE